MAAQWGGTDGSVELIDYANNITIWTAEAADWSVDAGAFNAGALSNIEDIRTGEVSMFPNPTQDHVNIEINSNSNQNINIDVYNNLGKVVYHKQEKLSQGVNRINMNLDNLLPGLYYVNTEINGESNLQPLTIVK